jgi:hypothetical protein
MDSNTQPLRERRHYKLFITRNTEYHVHDGRVVAVRPRGSARFLEAHSALGMSIKGRIERGSLMPLPGEPTPGERLYLASGKNDLVTSTIVSIERPARETVAEYPSRAA